MTFTYDLNENGCLILKADTEDRDALKGLASETGEFGYSAEYDALEHLIANSELSWIQPEEIGALTSAPILGFRDGKDNVTNAWAFMDYQVRSFVQDLIDKGRAVFVS